MLSAIRWIVFDAVGTLIFPDPPVAEVYFAAGLCCGSRLTADEIRSRFRAALAAAYSSCRPTSEPLERMRWQQIVSTVFDDVPDSHGELFEQLWQHFADPQYWRLFDDVAPVLSQLHRRGHRLGIASNFDGRLRHIVAGHPPLAACQPIFVSSEVGFTKPDPRFFATVTRQLAAEPAEILLIGDDETADVTAARAAGWQARLLCRNKSTPPAGALPSLRQLLDA
jgi:putative hydrolase of the HAD superfamily